MNERSKMLAIEGDDNGFELIRECDDKPVFRSGEKVVVGPQYVMLVGTEAVADGV